MPQKKPNVRFMPDTMKQIEQASGCYRDRVNRALRERIAMLKGKGR